jgi:hypothetical protein
MSTIIFRSGTWWVGVGAMLLSTVILWASEDWTFRASFFPRLTALVIFFCAFLHTVLGLVRGTVEKDATATATASDGDETGRALLYKRLVLFSWILAFLLVIPVLGHLVTVPLFLFVFMIAHHESVWMSAAVTAGVWSVIYFLLHQLIHIQFPPSMLFFILQDYI